MIAKLIPAEQVIFLLVFGYYPRKSMLPRDLTAALPFRLSSSSEVYGGGLMFLEHEMMGGDTLKAISRQVNTKPVCQACILREKKQ